VIPTLTGAGASSLAPERFATGAAVLTMGRQIGAALGVALLVAVLGSGGASASDFHTAWLITVICGLLTGGVLAAIGPPLGRAGETTPARASAAESRGAIAFDSVEVASLPPEDLVGEPA
jgi:hypothetical protein